MSDIFRLSGSSTAEMPAGFPEVTPVVANGIMYVTASNDAYAPQCANRTDPAALFSARFSGFDRHASGYINRGVALWAPDFIWKLTMLTSCALTHGSGNLIWDVAYADWNKNPRSHECPTDRKRQSTRRNIRRGRRSLAAFLAAFRLYLQVQVSMASVDNSRPGRIRLFELAWR